MDIAEFETLPKGTVLRHKQGGLIAMTFVQCTTDKDGMSRITKHALVVTASSDRLEQFPIGSLIKKSDLPNLMVARAAQLQIMCLYPTS